MDIIYKAKSYKRIVNDNLDGVEVISWWSNEISNFVASNVPLYEIKEILDSDFANELEIHYESVIIFSITPELPII